MTGSRTERLQPPSEAPSSLSTNCWIWSRPSALLTRSWMSANLHPARPCSCHTTEENGKTQETHVRSLRYQILSEGGCDWRLTGQVGELCEHSGILIFLGSFV